MLEVNGVYAVRAVFSTATAAAVSKSQLTDASHINVSRREVRYWGLATSLHTLQLKHRIGKIWYGKEVFPPAPRGGTPTQAYLKKTHKLTKSVSLTLLKAVHLWVIRHYVISHRSRTLQNACSPIVSPSCACYDATALHKGWNTRSEH